MPEAYAFAYLRAGDMKEVEQGPFLTPKEAEDGKKMMESMGAVCSAVHPYEGDSEKVNILKAGVDGYVAKKVKEFEVYLQKEIDVLETGIGYGIIYKYIEELSERVTRFVKEHVPHTFDETENVPKKTIKKFAVYRKEYLEKAAKILKDKSDGYSPLDGSVPEDIGEALKRLSGSVKNMR